VPGGWRHGSREPVRVDTSETATLSGQTIATITVAARTMYPHDRLPDDVYARVGGKLAEAARADPAAARMIEAGASALDGGGPFVELSADEQLEALKRVEGSDFFELVRSTAVVEVYSDERTWQLCGYEGPSFEKGGYIDRGFDDLDWLADPGEAS
jgi:hypothetical protein